MKKALIPSFILIVLLYSVAALFAAIPETINYQGYLTNRDGDPLTGDYEMVFSLYDDATAGNEIWTETQIVAVEKGIFNVTLGTVTPLAVSFRAPYYLAIRVAGEEMTERQPLSSVAYALAVPDDSITADAIADDAVTADAIADGAVTTNAIAGGAVTTSQIANYTIANEDLAGGSYDSITGVGTLGSLAVSGKTRLASSQSAGPDTVGIGSNVTNPRAMLEIGGYDGLLCTGTVNMGTARALGAGVRFHWYPRRGALRAGMAETAWWDDDGSSSPKLALYSVGIGYQPRASGVASTAIGAYNRATGDYGLALGSYCYATGEHSIAIGTQVYATGIYSMALGAGADTNNKDGAVVIGDDTYFATTLAPNDNSMSMRFCGLNDGDIAYQLFTDKLENTGVYMRRGESGWTAVSSREKKENFTPVDGEWILSKIRDIPITRWNYKAVEPSVTYIGPMAEDFWDAFQLNGDDNKGINSVSIDGVNMAGVKALEKRTSDMQAEMEEQAYSHEAEITGMKAEIDSLKAEIAALKALIAEK